MDGHNLLICASVEGESKSIFLPKRNDNEINYDLKRRCRSGFYALVIACVRCTEVRGKVMLSLCQFTGGGVPQSLVPGPFLGRRYSSLWCKVLSSEVLGQGTPSPWQGLGQGGREYPDPGLDRVPSSPSQDQDSGKWGEGCTPVRP